MTKYGRLCVLLALLMLGVSGSVRAQVDDLDAPRKAAFYRYVEPGQATMRVSVWGDVSAPGRYEVQAGTDLLDLLFLAGGTSEGVRRTNERRRTSVLLSRRTGTTWSVVFEASLEDITARQQPYPPLQDGDALKIETVVSRTFSWRDAVTVVGAAGTIALVIDRISRVSNR